MKTRRNVTMDYDIVGVRSYMVCEVERRGGPERVSICAGSFVCPIKLFCMARKNFCKSLGGSVPVDAIVAKSPRNVDLILQLATSKSASSVSMNVSATPGTLAIYGCKMHKSL